MRGRVTAYGFAGLSFSAPSSIAAQSPEAAAETIITQESYAPSQDKEILKLMDEGYSMEQAFAVTQVVQEKDPSYQYCHVLGHYLAAKETQKDPEIGKM